MAWIRGVIATLKSPSGDEIQDKQLLEANKFKNLKI